MEPIELLKEKVILGLASEREIQHLRNLGIYRDAPTVTKAYPEFLICPESWKVDGANKVSVHSHRCSQGPQTVCPWNHNCETCGYSWVQLDQRLLVLQARAESVEPSGLQGEIPHQGEPKVSGSPSLSETSTNESSATSAPESL